MYRFFFHIKVSLEIFGMQFKNKFTKSTKTTKVNISTCPIFSPSNLHLCFSQKHPWRLNLMVKLLFRVQEKGIVSYIIH